jgi:hypothetical protein
MAAIAILVAVLATAGSVLAYRGAAEPLPDPAEFRAGTCRTIAEPLLALARLDRELDAAREVPAADQRRIAAAQKRLIAARDAADSDLARPLRQLINSIGYVRLRSDTSSYDTGVWRSSDDRRRAVQRLCLAHR